MTVEVLAAEAINTDPAVRFGYYKPGNRAADAKTELFTISGADAQSLQADAARRHQLRPRLVEFRPVHAPTPASRTRPRTAGCRARCSARTRSTSGTASPPTGTRSASSRCKRQSGTVVPNAYIAPFEEFDTAFDSNDIVVIVRNVKPAAGGARRSGWRTWTARRSPTGWRSAGSRTRTTLATPASPNNKFHDTAVLRIRNTGSSALVLNSLALNNAFFQLVNPPAAGTSIAAGSSLDLTVKFVSTTAAT